MSFLKKDDELQEKFNKICKKSQIVLKQNLIVNQCTVKISKTKIKTYQQKISTDFQDDRIPRKRFSLHLSFSNIN